MWFYVNLVEISNPKQWPTISTNQLTTNGYPVYGANGQIGYYKTYNHENPTLLITCRGATCGTLNITPPKTYVTGNAMALDDIDENIISLRFLYYALLNRGLSDTITGAAQPQITLNSLKKVKIPLPPLSEQRRIVEILDQADEIRKLCKQANEKAEKIIPALFYEMFGDVATNSKNWRKKRLSKMCIEVKQTVTGNERNDLPYLGLENIESGTGNILISEDEAKKNKIIGTSFLFNQNNILFGKLRPYLNKVALPNFSGKCSTELVPLLPLEGYTRQFLATILRSKFVVDNLMLKNKGAQMPRADMKFLMNIEIIDPDKDLIIKFSSLYSSINAILTEKTKSKKLFENIFNILLSKAFDGSLTASWREAHMQELLKEMEEQKKYLEGKINA
jgi:type I restriction enzyme S subunit